MISESFLVVSDIFHIFAHMEAKKENLSDHEIVEGLIAKDNYITREFFWNQCCGIFNHIIYSLYDDHPQKESLKEKLIQELYLYLLDNDAHVLRTFNYESSLLTWLRQVAYRFYERKLDKENKKKEAEDDVASSFDDDSSREYETEETRKKVQQVLEAMPDQELAYILSRKYLDDCCYKTLALELGKTTAYLYVLKQRAVEMFKDTYYKLEKIDYAQI